MRLSKRIVLVSSIISVVTVLCTVLINLNSNCNKTLMILDSIMQNVFAGTIVLVITSLYEYFNEKKDTMEDILLYIQKIKQTFSKIEFFDGRDYVDYKMFEEYYKDKLNKDEIEMLYNKSMNEYYIKQKQKFEEIINTYIEIADEDYNSFWNCYKKIDFLIDKNKKEKHRIYYKLFDYVYNYKVKKIREKAWHFKEYKNSENGNYEVNKSFLISLQEEIFCYEEINIDDLYTFEQFSISENEVDFCSWGEDSMRKVYYIIGNKVTKHLSKIYDYIYNKFYYKSRGEEKMKIEYKNQPITYEEYNEITEKVGWGIRKKEIIEEALNNTLFSVAAYDKNRIVGYGRIIGDKTIFLHIQDIIVIPEYQGKGIGSKIMEELLKQIDIYKRVNPNIRTYLGATKGREAFYERFGFEARSNEELGPGMILKMKK